jgi:transposase-like protein
MQGRLAALYLERRRHWTPEQKAALLAEVEGESGRVSVIARRHGISTSLLYNWRSAWYGPVPASRSRPMPQASAQGRAIGLLGCGDQAAPRRALAQKPVQGRQHSDRRRGRMATPVPARRLAGVDHRRDEMQNPDV